MTNADKLETLINKIAGSAGSVIYARMADPMTDGSWQVVLDTEFAALRVYYAYRNTPGVRFGESKNLGGWFVSVIN